jgi:hypothetical protein
MTPKAKKLLDIIKRPRTAAPEQKVGGTDPMEPWSAQNKISESPNLNKYLLSRGFDPNHTPKDIKVAHSKSNQFKIWQRQHFNEDLTTKHTGTGVDHKTDLSVSPTMKRAATLTKAKKHYEVPNPPGSMRKEDIEQIDEIDANAILGLAKKVNPNARLVTTDQKKKERDELDAKRSKEAEGKPKSTGHVSSQSVDFGKNKGYGQGRYMGDSVEIEGETFDEGFNAPTETGLSDKTLKSYRSKIRAKAQTAEPKKSFDLKNKAFRVSNILDTRAAKRKNVTEENLDEISLGDYKQKAQSQAKELKKHTKGEYGSIAQRMLDRRNKGLKMVSKRDQKIETESDLTEANKKKDTRTASEKMSDYAVKRHKVYQDIQDKQKELMKKWNDDHKDEPHLQVPIPEDVGDPQAAIKGVPVPESMAKRIKAIYKKKVTEDTYDSEKDDKYGQNPTFGKKPVIQKPENAKKTENIDNVKTKAAAVLTGGTTLTGQKRDSIQIDPELNNPRPGQSDPNGDRSNK